MPWNELLANLAIVALASSIWTAAQGTIVRYPILWQRLAMGVLMGAATLLAMLLPFQFTSGVFLDLRYTIVAISAFFGGPVAAVIPVIVAVFRRLALGGTGIWVAIPNLAMAFGFGWIGRHLCRQRVPSIGALVGLAAAVVVSGTLGFFVMMPVEKWFAMVTGVVAPFGLMLFVATFFSALAISQELKRQATLKENWTYRAVIDALPDCLSAKDLDGRFIAANPATARLVGAADVGSLIARTDADFYPAETAAGFRQKELELIGSGSPKAFEEEITRPDGTNVWLSTLKAPLNDSDGKIVGVITHNREITDRKRLELELAQTQNHLTEALSSMDDGLALFDADRNLVFSNGRYLEMFPLTADVRVPGASLKTIIEASRQRHETVPCDPSETDSVDDIVEELTAAVGTREIRMTDGRWLQARARATRNGGSMIMFTDVSRMKNDQRALRELNARLLDMANTDGLTGLTNRRSFDLCLQDAIADFAAADGDVGLLMIDVDKFKAFNDTYGHPAGDECLRRVAGCLTKVVSGFSEAVVGRYGGEEFAIVLPRLGLAESASVGRLVMTAIRALGSEDPDGPMFLVTVSVGVASLKSGAAEMSELLARADAALYEAKAAGRDCVRISGIKALAPMEARSAVG